MSREWNPNEFRTRLLGYQCVYCGMTADTGDHFPPKSLIATGWILPACRECNCFAGTVWSRDFRARCNHVKLRIREKYQKVLETPEWSDHEIKQLGRNLKSKVKPWRELRSLVQERLAWNVEAYLACIDRNNAFALWRAEIDSTTSNASSSWRLCDGMPVFVGMNRRSD